MAQRPGDWCDHYDDPLVARYASAAMSRIFSPQQRYSTWRRLWVALAEAQAEMGLPIRPEQLAALRAKVDQIDFQAAADYEQKLRHDVMAHVHTFGDAAPEARGIIHLGATSCFVTDNTDLLLMREALQLLRRHLVGVIGALGSFAARHRDLACLGFTHFQPAQPTTVGKRACLWAYDFVLDLEELEHRLAALKFRGAKGTTGTQASFLKLFDGDHEKVRRLDELICRKLGFAESYPVVGQTYSRKVDAQVLAALSGIAQSAHKMATDLRLLAHRREIDEPFEQEQVGSSAMAYKRNPMRCERICSLARFLMGLEPMAWQTAAVQWLERTLDDSAARRLYIPQAFLAADAVLLLVRNVVAGLVVYPQMIAANLAAELPFMATENILMAAVAAGGDRQQLHERIRRHSQAAAAAMKQEGRPNDLLERLKSDEAFVAVDMGALLDPRQFIGRAPQQVDEFLAGVLAPLLAKYPPADQDDAEPRV